MASVAIDAGEGVVIDSAAALRLVDVCLEGDLAGAAALVAAGTHAWVQDAQGWTALHAAAASGNAELVTFLLKKSNAVWNMGDNLGLTPGDIAYSYNHEECYEELRNEAVRREMLRMLMEAPELYDTDTSEGSDEASEAAKGDTGGAGDVDIAVDANPADTAEPSSTNDEAPVTQSKRPRLGTPPKSTKSDNATYLKSKLTFTTDENGQDICLDAEGSGVMMGWERDIMRETVAKLLEPHGDNPVRVLNVGFGLGIIDSFFQERNPELHVIIEPHPDVLAYAKRNGWFEKPNVVFYEGTWQNFVKEIIAGTLDYQFNVVYFDTYSEHYEDLYLFFQQLPELTPLNDTDVTFSFFNGLGAKSWYLYDVYSLVSQMNVRNLGFDTLWSTVEINNTASTWTATQSTYWGDVGPYRLPLCTSL